MSLYVTRPRATWMALIDAIAWVTGEPADVDRCDRRAAAVAADSAIVRRITSAATTWRRVLAQSKTLVLVRRYAGSVGHARMDRVRAGGIITCVAAVTALVTRLFASDYDPLTWILPAAAALIGLGMAAAARHSARALDHYRS